VVVVVDLEEVLVMQEKVQTLLWINLKESVVGVLEVNKA